MLIRLKGGNFIYYHKNINCDFNTLQIDARKKGYTGDTSPEILLKDKNRKRKERFIQLALNNDFRYFITLTYKDSLYTSEKFYNSVKWHFRTYFNKYIIVPEFGKKTNRFHLHILTDTLPWDTYINDYGFLTCDKFFWGNHDIKLIDMDNYTNLIYYLSKYLTKDVNLKNVYSRNLNTSLKGYDIIDFDNKFMVDKVVKDNIFYTRFLISSSNVKKGD